MLTAPHWSYLSGCGKHPGVYEFPCPLCVAANDPGIRDDHQPVTVLADSDLREVSAEELALCFSLADIKAWSDNFTLNRHPRKLPVHPPDGSLDTEPMVYRQGNHDEVLDVDDDEFLNPDVDELEMIPHYVADDEYL